MTTILIIEDNEDNRDMLVRRLQRRGFHMLHAGDGAEGIEKARAENPDVILMDMDLPVIDGWTATSMLKQDPATQHIVIIGLSANAMKGDRERGLAAGCDDYETKPVDMDRLIDKINALLARR